MDAVECDVGVLISDLSITLGEDVVDVTVLHDGLNLSLGIDTAAKDDAYVLRRPNKFRNSDGFLDVHREYGVLEHLHHTPVPAPKPVAVGDGNTILGDPFLITTYVEGEAVALGSLLPDRFRYPAARQQFGEAVVETLADLHNLDTAPFSDVCERKSLRDQVEEVINRMEAATRETGHEPPAVWEVAEWLRDNIPEDSTTAVCHGDFRPGNILFVGGDRPQVGGVIDWETTWLGDPRTELGYLLLRWRDEADPTPPVEEIAARHPQAEVTEELTGDDAPCIAPYTTKPGSPTRRELVERYQAETGITFVHDRFYRTLAAFDLAAIWADIYREQLQSGSAGQWEPNIEYLLLIAESIACGDHTL
ncbi:phosphotransferase family protein [Halovenus rubra]|uniref:Phosphotransferase family protein n=2 Tax=Halovenus rubra TaxID=869890 RepID=A0ACC7E298_9EURY|nr:phosphotransferase family protein [Halovenus rubra]